MPVHFDNSLPILANAIAMRLGTTVLEAGVVVRDVSGRLAFFLADEIESATLHQLRIQLQSNLGVYARTDRVLVECSDVGASNILNDPIAHRVSAGEFWVRLIDRRLVGADWLRTPAPAAPPPPRFVFASLKGGVGRSTALSVAAANMASQGRRVLAIDLDLEAPGLGPMLLNEGTLPEFGLIDALVENGLAPLEDQFLADLVGPSALADRTGKIDVIPAFGRRSLANPGDVLSKIARAYAEDIGSDGAVSSMLDQVRSLVDRFSDPKRYDAILVDVRAGLHESTASAILGLGAEVLLFGLDEPQTFQGYRVLLAHMARFGRTNEQANTEWLERITMVQGKAPADEGLRAHFAEACNALFVDSGLDGRASSAPGVPLPAAPFGNVPWVEDGEVTDAELHLDSDRHTPEPIAILDDERFRHFEPSKRKDLLVDQVYRSSYGVFIDRLNEAFPQSIEGKV